MNHFMDCRQSPIFSHGALFAHIMAVMEDTHVLLISKRRMFARSFAKIIQVQRQEAVVMPVVDVAEACHKLTKQRFSLAFFDVEQSTPLESDSYGQQGTESTQTAMDEMYSALLTLTAVQQDLRFVPVFHEQQDEHIESIMVQGAAGVIVKSAPPGVLAEYIERLFQGQVCRPAPIQIIGAEALTESMRKSLSARQQKLLRLVMGGEPISSAARKLSITPAKVVVLMREINEVIRGKQ